MKKWIRILIGVVVTLLVLLVIFVGVPLFLFHMNTDAPTEQYVPASETVFYSALDQELESLITDPEADQVFLRIDEAFINRLIQKALSGDNPKFLNPDNEGELAYDYMIVFGGIAGVKGVWTMVSDDQIKVTAGADLVFGRSLTYQTGVEIIFDIVLSENEEYYLKVAEITIGRMKPSLRQAFRLTDFIIKNLTQKSLNDMIAEQLAFGAFDADELSFTVSETELSEYLYAMNPAFAGLLKIVYQESLLTMDVSDEGFDVTIGIGAFRRFLDDQDEPAFDRWDTVVDKAMFMADIAAQAASNALLHPLDPQLELTEADVNAILDYTLGEKVQFRFPIEFSLDGEAVLYEFASTNLYVTMEDERLSAHLRMSLTKAGMAGAFEMQFNLETTVGMNSQDDMVLTIVQSNIGEVLLDNEILENLFALFDDTLFVDGAIVIPKEKINEMFEGSGIIIHDSYVIGGKLRLHFGLDL